MAGMLSSFIAGAASTGADLYSKKAMEDMRLDSDLEKARRIAEYHEQAAINTEDRKRQADLDAGADIESGAQERLGKKAADREQMIQSKFGGQTAAEFDSPGGSLPEERSMVPAPSTRLDALQTKADVAEANGNWSQAKEIRAQIQSEISNKRADNQDENTKRRDDNTAAFQMATVNNNAEKVQHAYETGALKMQLEQAKLNNHVPDQIKYAIQARYDALKHTLNDVALDEGGRAKRVGEIEKTFGPALLKSVDIDEKTKVATVHTWDGSVKSFPNLADARAAYGLGAPAKPEPAKPEPAKTSAVSGAYDAVKGAATRMIDAVSTKSPVAAITSQQAVVGPPNQTLVDQAAREATEMGEGTRMNWSSPAVKAAYDFAKQIESQKAGEDLLARQREFNRKMSGR